MAECVLPRQYATVATNHPSTLVSYQGRCVMSYKQILRAAGAVVLSVAALTASATTASADPNEIACASAEASVNGQDVVNETQCLVLPL